MFDELEAEGFFPDVLESVEELDVLLFSDVLDFFDFFDFLDFLDFFDFFFDFVTVSDVSDESPETLSADVVDAPVSSYGADCPDVEASSDELDAADAETPDGAAWDEVLSAVPDAPENAHPASESAKAKASKTMYVKRVIFFMA
ncbi:MAG: hypothetical protein IJH88_08115 [Eggerthellaceae bacterium]|nr:hypothetical protein [Eggerthellaceae bacterium]